MSQEKSTEEKLRIMTRGFEAAMNWPYMGDMLEHIANPKRARGKNYDDCYLADIQDMHSAYLLTKAGHL